MLIASAAHLRPTSLELGGKSAIVVFDDARENMGALLDWLMLGIFCTTGQICSATSRLIVQDTLHDELVEQLKLVRAAEDADADGRGCFASFDFALSNTHKLWMHVHARAHTRFLPHSFMLTLRLASC